MFLFVIYIFTLLMFFGKIVTVYIIVVDAASGGLRPTTGQYGCTKIMMMMIIVEVKT